MVPSRGLVSISLSTPHPCPIPIPIPTPSPHPTEHHHDLGIPHHDAPISGAGSYEAFTTPPLPPTLPLMPPY